MNLQLRNPHSVLATLKERAHDVLEVRLASRQPHGVWKEVVAIAESHRIPVLQSGHNTQQVRRTSRKQGKEQRVSSAEATIRAKSPISLDHLLQDGETKTQESSNSTSLWLALDCLQDPHNVGAIFRSAAFFGIKGILHLKDRSSPINSTVYDVASGGMEYVPLALETNLSSALGKAKEQGVWILGTSEHARKDVREIELDRPWMVVIGNEEKGLRKLTTRQCDELCKFPSFGEISSLNASVATATILTALRCSKSPEQSKSPAV